MCGYINRSPTRAAAAAAAGSSRRLSCVGVFLVADAPKKNDLNRGNIISISEGFLSNDSRPFIEIIFPVKRFFGENSKNLKNQTSKGDNLFKSVVAPPVDHFSEKKLF